MKDEFEHLTIELDKDIIAKKRRGDELQDRRSPRFLS
jgi:hypothetical protein